MYPNRAKQTGLGLLPVVVMGEIAHPYLDFVLSGPYGIRKVKLKWRPETTAHVMPVDPDLGEVTYPAQIQDCPARILSKFNGPGVVYIAAEALQFPAFPFL